jgi:succinate dehydrogenase/fumarate reductase flavoprotein subunit
MKKELVNNGLEITTDVLVIGGGPAACWAAISAAREGVRVVIADKGHLGSSGALAASTAGARVIPPVKELRDKTKFERYALGGHLAQHALWDRILQATYENAPDIYAWGGYERPDYEGGREAYTGGRLQGPEIMKIMRKRVKELGITILDQSPALELLVADDGSVAGARGIQRQENRGWTVKAASVVLASGGCAWLSKALGCNTNTGDGLLMASEAGAELSGMEFSAHYSPAPKHSSVTKSAFYRYASFVDKEGQPIGGASKDGHRSTSTIAKALLNGPVFCRLDKGTSDPRQREILRLSQPNFMAAFTKVGIDPFEDWWEITLVLEGTVRGTGGIRVASEDCGTTIPGLFAAGDAASRELTCGAFTGGAGPNMTWAIGSGNIAGAGAASHAKKLGSSALNRTVKAVGTVGLVAKTSTETPYDANQIVKDVQAEVLPYDKNIFRTEEGLVRSLAKLANLWNSVQTTPAQATPQQVQRSREAAALVAAARWSYFAGLERKETRGMHKRLDYPKLDPQQRHYLAVGGLDKLWTRPVPVPEPIHIDETGSNHTGYASPELAQTAAQLPKKEVAA